MDSTNGTGAISRLKAVSSSETCKQENKLTRSNRKCSWPGGLLQIKYHDGLIALCLFLISFLIQSKQITGRNVKIHIGTVKIKQCFVFGINVYYSYVPL